MALPHGTTGSLSPGFPSVRPVSLTVKLPYAFALVGWFPSSLREPLGASVTLWEATAPVKLPTRQGPDPGSRDAVRMSESPGWYFTVGSPGAGASGSLPPTYPTQAILTPTVKL